MARLRGKDLEDVIGVPRSGAEENMAKQRQAQGTVKVTLVRSPIGFDRTQARDRASGMGLRRIRHTVTSSTPPRPRGMIHKVRHLVTVAE